ncbi:MAG: DNA translocase FtsK 4TM domain-containing protein, partial [Bacillota bacterium]|nr:DNA translocase FtsK 4TM domain-containing protein [Bacillota bacterium]
MTETKRKPGRPPGSKNKNSKSSSKSTAKSTAKGTAKGSTKASEGKINSRVKDEIVAILTIALGAFLAIAFHTELAGEVGIALSQFFKGVFGFAAYILPYYFIIYGILLFTNKTIHVGTKSVILLIIIFLMISLINSGRFITDEVITDGLLNAATHYNNGMNLDDGGLFGMVCGKLIVKLLGISGLYILASVAIIICMLLLMNTPVSRFFEKAKERKLAREASKEERRIEREKEEQIRNQQMQMLMEKDTHSTNAFGEAAASNMSDRQRKIMGYMSSEDRVSGRDGRREEQLDFSLGENKEKPKRGRRRKTDIEAGLASKDASPEADAFKNEPVIIGGFSPKAAEEKLTKSEAAKASLKEEDFNVTVTSADDYQFPAIDLLKKAS